MAEKHSTETTLVKPQSNIFLNVDQYKITELALIDLPAEFDTVGHERLFSMDCLFFWNKFSSYLQSKSQRVIINGVRSV